jgi:hypothetical protein
MSESSAREAFPFAAGMSDLGLLCFFGEPEPLSAIAAREAAVSAGASVVLRTSIFGRLLGVPCS